VPELTPEIIAERSVLFLHTLWWLAFLTGRALSRRGGPAGPRHEDDPLDAPYARLLVRAHSAVIIGLYPAIWLATTPGATQLHPPLRGLGGALIVVGAGLVLWTLSVFRSYRLRATLEPGHELCQAGPFQRVRHPIYLAFGLLGAGTALWAPSPLVYALATALWMLADLRARNEERLLRTAFGDRYSDYMTSSKRLLPFVY